MPAYVIGKIQMRDPSWLAEYRSKVGELVAKHGGRYVVRGGKMETLEGKDPLPSTFVVLEFPTMEKARAWHQDPEYAPLIRLRSGGSDTELVLVEGL